jgi:polyisoprenoid-binding protein YceI
MGVGVLLTAHVAYAAVAYKADSAHSSMVFRVKHMDTTYFWGRFNAISGSYTLDQDPAKCQFAFEVKTESVDTGIPKRDTHLKSPDFFNAVQFPTISFKSRSVASAGQGAYDVTGDLTLHGVTKPVTVKITQTGSGSMRGRAITGIEGTFAIKRSDFGMKGMVGPVGDDVWISVCIEGGQQ